MNTIVWLYSGAISGWWCYDEQSTLKLNKMYINYCTKNLIDCSEFITINTKSDYEISNDFVNFNSDNNLIEDDEINKNIIRTIHGDYKIDFNKMIQVGLYQNIKKRNVKYLVIPNIIANNEQNLNKYLSDNNVKGIAGIPFK